jgi:hypothetical protein
MVVHPPSIERMHMRIVTGMLVLAVMMFTAGASRADSSQTGGYFAVELQVSSLNKGLAWIIGLSGGYQTDDGTRFGLAIYDLLNGTRFPKQDPEQPARRTKMHWGGLIIGQEFGVSGDWRPSASVLLGGPFGSLNNALTSL